MACNCANKKRIKPTVVCSGDRRDLVDIQTRTLGNSGFTSSQPELVFATVRQQWCGIETVNKGVSRFAKINIEENATHLFWTSWDSGFPDIETNNHFILHDSKRYDVLKVNNINERNTTIVIQTAERGKTSEEAAKA